MPAARPIVIVSPAPSAVVAVNPTVQVERESAVAGDAEKVTALGAVAALIVTFPAGVVEVVSSLVRTAKSVFVYVAAGGVTSPATGEAPDCPPGGRHEAPVTGATRGVPGAAPGAGQPGEPAP